MSRIPLVMLARNSESCLGNTSGRHPNRRFSLVQPASYLKAVGVGVRFVFCLWFLENIEKSEASAIFYLEFSSSICNINKFVRDCYITPLCNQKLQQSFLAFKL